LYDVGEHHNYFVENICVHNMSSQDGTTREAVVKK